MFVISSADRNDKVLIKQAFIMFNNKEALTKTIILTAFLASVSLSAKAQEKSIEEAGMPTRKLATQEEAKALFDWAMVYLKINGRDIAYKAFNQVDGKFTDRDLYVFCLDYNKTWKVMGANPLLVGNSARDKRDLNGKDFVEEFVTIARNSGVGTASYTYTNPISGKEQLKISFIMKVAENEFCGMGYYKQ
jgi:signal transduction histidine kinase